MNTDQLADVPAPLAEPQIAHPLLFAASDGALPTIKKLLEDGADPDVRCVNESTPLMYAILNSHNDAADLLLKRNAKTELRDCQGRTALVHAACEGNINGVKLLIRYGAAPSLKVPRSYYALVPLQYATEIHAILEAASHPVND